MWRESKAAKWALAWRKGTIGVVLALAVAVSAPSAERMGDRLQIALPLLGLGCAVLTGGAGEYLLRFATLEVIVRGSKIGLGDAALNQRPRGGIQGFPSGHTAAASFGASALVQECLTRSPFVQGVVIFAAAFTGTSRVEARAHNIWQVLAGALVGWSTERVLRRNTPMRQRIVARCRQLFRRRRDGL